MQHETGAARTYLRSESHKERCNIVREVSDETDT